MARTASFPLTSCNPAAWIEQISNTSIVEYHLERPINKRLFGVGDISDTREHVQAGRRVETPRLCSSYATASNPLSHRRPLSDQLLVSSSSSPICVTYSRNPTKFPLASPTKPHLLTLLLVIHLCVICIYLHVASFFIPTPEVACGAVVLHLFQDYPLSELDGYGSTVFVLQQLTA
ncbi:hypothetical protein EDD16DRAFT_1012464 [Pisolithus croceorrhizus]|nr:hypothetical protein EDD16DRAFT_1012464 [Pisolithus croceorrhizus]